MANSITIKTNSTDTDAVLMRCLKEIAEQEGFKRYIIKIDDDGLHSGGFLGNIVKARIINEFGCIPEKSLNMVIKEATKDDNVRKQISVSNIFIREIYLYDTIFPYFQLFEKQRNLIPIDFIPKLYKAESEEKSERIIIGNLCAHGFKHHNSKAPMDKHHLNLVLSTYGRLHALSFAIKDQQPIHFTKLVDAMDEIFMKFVKSGGFVETLKTNCEKALKLLAPTLSSNDFIAFQRIIQKIPSIVYDLVPIVDNYSVIIHGDCWINNMMFKYQENTGSYNPVDIRLLDFQFARLGSPVLDLSYFFYSCSSKEALKELESYLHVYYNSLSSYLYKLGSCPEKLFPYVTLKSHWKKYAQVGLIMAPTLLNFMLAETSEAVDLSEAIRSGQAVKEAFAYKISNVELYKIKIQNVLTHFLENKFI